MLTMTGILCHFVICFVLPNLMDCKLRYIFCLFLNFFFRYPNHFFFKKIDSSTFILYFFSSNLIKASIFDLLRSLTLIIYIFFKQVYGS